VLLVRRIAYLKSLGFSLREVQRLISDNLTEEEQIRIFEKKRHDVKVQFEQDQWRLSALDQHLLRSFPLDYLDQSTKEITMELEIKKLPGFKVAGLLYFGKTNIRKFQPYGGNSTHEVKNCAPLAQKLLMGFVGSPVNNRWESWNTRTQKRMKKQATQRI